VFGSPPETTAAAATPDIASLVKAIATQQQQIAALQEMVGELVRAIGEDRQGPPWLDDAVPAAAAYIERRVLNAIAGALTGQGPGSGATER
jgi:3-methyladenine DNA glycosylase/8-oxoguanine DNA glycosylase